METRIRHRAGYRHSDHRTQPRIDTHLDPDNGWKPHDARDDQTPNEDRESLRIAAEEDLGPEAFRYVGQQLDLPPPAVAWCGDPAASGVSAGDGAGSGGVAAMDH